MEETRAPKRLRGWKLKQQMEDPCQKGHIEHEENALCIRLTELWSQGRISATQVAEICHLSVLNGCEHPDMVAMVKCGDFGQRKSNVHRDLTHLHCKAMRLPNPHFVRCPVKDPKTQRVSLEEIPVMLPHMVFSSLSQHYPETFEQMYAMHHCEAFWKSTEKLKDPRLVKPITLSKGKVDSPGKTVPLFLHGDGCEFQTRDSLMTWSWGSLLSKNPSLSSHLLITAVPKSCTVQGTWDPLDAWICWSLAALTKGMHPDTDPWGKVFTKGPLAELAGQPLTKGLDRAVLWSIQGDLEFNCNVLKLPHWNTKYPCHECDGQKPIHQGVHCPEGKSVKILKQDDQRFNYTSPAQALLDKRSKHPLFTLEGVSTALVRHDSLHILYSRGVASHLAGSLLFYLCWYDWPRRQAVPASERLLRILQKSSRSILRIMCLPGSAI